MASTRQLLVIRFGSLGDLCLLGWSLSRVGAPDARDRSRVTLVTKSAFADLAGRMTGVDEVVALTPGGAQDLAGLAARLRRRRFDAVVDAHAVLRSALLLGLMGRRPRARLAKDTAARLRLLRGGRPAPALARTMRDRFDMVLAPWLADVPATAPLRSLAGAPREALGLAPGAQWATKRWPDEHFAALVAEFRRASGAPVRVFLGPREAAWFTTSALARALADLPAVEIWQGRDLVEVAGGLATCRLVVTNDSGLMHLAEATGTPVVAFFGPTVRAFGYFPQLPQSRVLEIDDLDCRPCSRNGKRPCWRGDLACLARIAPPQVLSTVMAAGPWPEAVPS